MSASLVGSEMCIRDRRTTLRRLRVVRAVHAMRSFGTMGSGPAAHLPPGPVSYTHLTLPTICSV
eukprot:11526101-Alexandrium_andersonii.AAC.1